MGAGGCLVAEEAKRKLLQRFALTSRDLARASKGGCSPDPLPL
jgi:hypothetical protein